MNLHEHLLSCLAEECAEVAQVVSKSLRFGLEDRNVLNPYGPTNRERLIDELNDLLGVVNVLVGEGILPRDWFSLTEQHLKQDKVRTFLNYALKVGALQCEGGAAS